jgi:DNA-binding transcriptional regulator LsrR (DeoR family)
LYYEQDLTQQEIALRLRLSRQKVQRLLKRARAEGVVRIHIAWPTEGFPGLESALEQRYHLREAVVVRTSEYRDQQIVAREVGAGAAEYVQRILESGDRVVISWGGTLLGLVNALSQLSPTHLAGSTVIQGLGGLVDPTNEAHASDLTRRLAQALGAQPVLLGAPGVVGRREAARLFADDPYVQHVLALARAATVALMGIGAPRQDSILVTEGKIVAWDELAELTRLGAVGDINLRYFDAAGNAVASDLDDRVIGLTLDEIKAIPHVVGIAGGAEKFRAVQGALHGHLMHVLVTDHITATALLEDR